jgi:aryl-alcohol dehydrogenase-like predicted oxidoreductase
MSLPTAPLGKGGPQVNRLGIGLMGLSAYYGAPKPDVESFAVLDKAYELGERFWDSGELTTGSKWLVM